MVRLFFATIYNFILNQSPSSPIRRVQTNATIVLSNGDRTATLSLGGEKCVCTLLSPSAGVFTTQAAIANSAISVVLPTSGESADQPNPGVTVLTVALGAGDQNIQVLWR